MENDTVDYGPLQGMQHAVKNVFKAWIKQPLGSLAFIILIIVPIGAAIMFGSPTTIEFFGAGPIVYVCLLAARVFSYRNGVWGVFAAVNGWALDVTTPGSQLIPPSMQFGRNPAFSSVIQAQLGQLSCDLFTFNTTVGEGRDEHTYHYTVARVLLPETLPHMLLLSKKAHAELQRDLVNRQDLQLEGDFDDYFKLQIEQGQQIDALTVITPDVMQTLVQYGQAEDIEILGSQLYFILNLDERNVQGMQQLIHSAMALSNQIIQNLAAEIAPVIDSELQAAPVNAVPTAVS